MLPKGVVSPNRSGALGGLHRVSRVTLEVLHLDQLLQLRQHLHQVRQVNLAPPIPWVMFFHTVTHAFSMSRFILEMGFLLIDSKFVFLQRPTTFAIQRWLGGVRGGIKPTLQ